MITLETLHHWLNAASESEHLEFKEAKQQFDTAKLMRYCVALANEGGGHLVLGVSDKLPRKIMGTSAFKDANDIKSRIHSTLHIRVELTELTDVDGRVLIFNIPGRPRGHPMQYEGAYWMRTGSELTPMTPDQLKKIFEEGAVNFLENIAITDLTANEVIEYLDTQTYFELLKLPYPSTQSAVLSRLVKENLLELKDSRYSITNLCALLLAKDLHAFNTVQRKAARVVVYKGKNKLQTTRDQLETKGYAVGYEGLIAFVNSQLPSNELVGQALRQQTSLYPEIAIRELVANALIHQDFSESGMSPMIEIFDDRIEVSNPGIPMIPLDRFVDEYKSRNERLADFMRRFGICEEKSSGIDNVVSSTEIYQLPAPDFRASLYHTMAILFAPQEFSRMDRKDRVRACYLHACLKYVSNEKMTNQSLRERFQLPESKAETVSRMIADALKEQLVKLDDAENASKRYAKYIPFWA